MLSVNDIRSIFLDYFKKHGHTIVDSSPLIPHNDPSLMFTNSGMVQFKDIFTGKEVREYKKAASSQKCVRAGGKHNDLDNVGYTARHHTFFEMLGNFSFGDYFKEEAINFAWELLTKEFKIPKDKLYITFYHDDMETRDLWKKIAGFSDDRLISIDTNDNFWFMADTGPCGPCTEIFFDHGAEIPGGLPGTADADGDRFVEIWNLVFTQYDQLASGEKQKLPKPCVDTGSGLERLAAVLQGVHNNYEIDIFNHIITGIAGHLGGKLSEKNISSFRVIADHVRSLSFLIADGILPSNEGRGYVVRRILRRAVRHAHILGAKEPLLHLVVPFLEEHMGVAYPELIRAHDLIVTTLKTEEENFTETLARGLKILDQEVNNIASNKILDGKVAFKLYDTYGFPVDLTVDILRGQNIKVDMQGFEESMQVQRQMAKNAWVGSGEQATETIWFELKQKHGETEFVGYETDTLQARIIAIIHNNQLLDKTSGNLSNVMIITNQTPFYAESGGQEGDSGIIKTANGEFKVHDTIKNLDIYAHKLENLQGELKIGDIVTLSIDQNRRDKLRANHSATHLLHTVLRQLLGNHVVQKGSLVAEDKLRLDFSHNKSLTSEEVANIELIVNQMIRHNYKQYTRLMSHEEAIKEGALALFGEKYGDEVRVVAMGHDKDIPASIELCGGTHVKRTGDIGAFIITLESSVAAGVRRIEAITGEIAMKYVINHRNILSQMANQLRISIDSLPERLSIMQDEIKNLGRDLSNMELKVILAELEKKVSIEKINNTQFAYINYKNANNALLANIAEELLKQKNDIVVVFNDIEDKTSILIAVNEALSNRISAAECIKNLLEAMEEAKGGGNKLMARGGGKYVADKNKFISIVRERLLTK